MKKAAAKQTGGTGGSGRSLDEYEIVRYEHALGFMRYVNSFNRLERNIALCIRCTDRSIETEAAYRALCDLTYQKKLKALEKAVAGNEILEGPEAATAFSEWTKLVDRSRTIRNDYVHGDWDIAPSMEKPIRFTPMRWSDGEKGPTTQEMTLNEFLVAVDEMEALADSFSQLRQQVGM